MTRQRNHTLLVCADHSLVFLGLKGIWLKRSLSSLTVYCGPGTVLVTGDKFIFHPWSQKTPLLWVETWNSKQMLVQEGFGATSDHSVRFTCIGQPVQGDSEKNGFSNNQLEAKILFKILHNDAIFSLGISCINAKSKFCSKLRSQHE